MTNQEAFNRIMTHLRRQGGKSTCPERKICRYRGADGRRCAVGVLITDEFYAPWMEGRSIASRKIVSLLSRAVPGVALRLLAACQCVHDSFADDRWEVEFKRVARQFRLTVPPYDWSPDAPEVQPREKPVAEDVLHA